MISVQTDGRQLKDMVGGNLRKFRNLQPPFRGVAYFMRDDLIQRSIQEVDPDGKKWAALAPSTLRYKRLRGYPDRILTATGKMWTTIRIIYTDKFAELRVVISYAQYHQEGTSKMPQRKLIGLNQKILGYAVKVIRGYIRGRGR